MISLLFSFDFNIGIILAILNATGKIPFSIDLLIVIDKGSLMPIFNLFNIREDIPSVPELFDYATYVITNRGRGQIQAAETIFSLFR